ncbi:hypothetical protein KCU88_g249, partial [Aureobasidium melanogenum]
MNSIHLIRLDDFATLPGQLNNMPVEMGQVARHLDLLEYARGQHMFLDDHASAATFVACLDLTVCRTGPFTLLTDLLFLNADLEVGTTSHSPSTAKVATTAEEPREQIEWVMAVSASATSSLMILQSFVPILIIHFPRRWVGQDFIGFGYFKEHRFIA